MSPQLHSSVPSLRAALAAAHSHHAPILLVPTMGALHEGHLELIRQAVALTTTHTLTPTAAPSPNAAPNPRIIVSIFVNPLQFGPKEDFARYPRSLEHDTHLAAHAGATDIFTPTAHEFTPADLTLTVDPGPMADVLCGASRPGHFRGVCTIVLKLFNAVQPTHALFGWKDAQQFIILRKMVRDFNLPIEMIGVETIREPNGLAMSSRNAYLSPQERQIAPALYRTLQEVKAALQSGAVAPADAETFARPRLAEAGITSIDYVQAISADTLTPLPGIKPQSPVLLAAAVRVGRTRLIDNLRF